jgi:protein-S-isoprenylcysteine O-methyltransferase Ste14
VRRGDFFTRWVGVLALILVSVYVLKSAIDEVKSSLPYIACIGLVVGAVWLFIWWRRRRGDY